VTLGGADASTPVALHNVAAGAQSNDAVNVSQLEGAGLTIDSSGNVTNSFVAYDDTTKHSVTLGGADATTPVALHNVANATQTNDAVNLSQLEAAGVNVDSSGNVTNSFVAYDDASKYSVTFGGPDASTPVALHNVAAGTVSASSNDAVNGSQLYGLSASAASALGGNTAVNPDGSLSTPSYVVEGSTYHNVGSALNAVTALAVGGSADAVIYDSSEHDTVTLGGEGASSTVALHNLAAGTASTDAVAVSQLSSAGFQLDSSGAVLNKAATYDAGSVAAGTPTITLDSGSSNSQQGQQQTGTRISNVADGIQDTDAANVGQIYDIVSLSQSNATATMQMSARVMAAAPDGSGVDTSGLTTTYNTAAYYSQVEGTGDGTGSVMPSDKARAVGAGAIAIGSNTLTTGTAGTAVGVQAYTSANDAVALGSGSVANEANTVSVGNDGTSSFTAMDASGQTYTIQNAANTRRIVNMAAGQDDTDAVNVSQLKGVTTALGGGAGVNADGSIEAPSYVVGSDTYSNVGSALQAVEALSATNAVTYDDTSKDSVTLGGTGSTTPVAVHNVANAMQGSDAVNLSQLEAAGLSVDSSGNVTNSFVAYDDTTKKSVTFGGPDASTPVALHNVAAGAQSNDAVNVSQLEDAGLTIDSSGNVTNAFVAYDDTTKKSVTFGGPDATTPVALHNVAAGAQSNDAVNVSQLEDAGLTIDSSGNVTNSFVAYDNASKDSVTFGGPNASTPVALHNVAVGTISASSSDAVNGSQLYGLSASTASALGGGTTVNPDGTLSTPSYVVESGTYSNVGSALDAVAALAKGGAADAVVYDTSAHDKVTLGGPSATAPVQVTNLANATNASDAVNLGQLQQAGLGVDSSGNVTNAFVAYDDTTKKSVTFGGPDATTPVALHNVAAGAQTSDAVNVSQLEAAGLTIDSSGNVTNAFVAYDDASKDSVTFGGPNASTPVALHNVAAGAQSNDAVNVSQLEAAGLTIDSSGNVTNAFVAYDDASKHSVTLGGPDASTPVALHNVANATQTNDAVNLSQLEAAGLSVDTSGNVTNSFVAYDDASKSKITLGGAGGTVITNVKSGSVDAASTDAVNGSQLYELEQQMNASGLGLVMQNSDGTITVGANTNGNVVDFSGTSGARKLTGVANGSVNATSNDAVNGAQLYGTAQSTASALGGGSTVNPDGTVSAPTYAVGGTTVNNVGDALTNLDGRVTNLQTTVTNIAGTVANAVQYDSSAHDQVTLGGTSATSTVKLTNLSDADLTATSTDAVTGEQLYATNQQVANLGQAIQNVSDSGSQYLSTNTTSGPAAATGNNSIAAGGGATASGASSTAVGDQASAQADNSVALGANSVADRANTVSVGSAGNERQITNVADGQAPTDAVNMRQFQSGMTSVQRGAYGGVAAATALTMIPDVDPGKTIAVGIGTANYKGYQATAIGASARITQNLKVKVGAGYSDGGGTTVGGGMSYQW